MTGGPFGAVHRAHAAALSAAGLDPVEVEGVVRRALEEDLALGPDVTTESTVSPRAQATGDIVPRSPGMLAGVPVAAAVFDLVGRGEVDVELLAVDGTAARPGEPVLTVAGPTRALLTAERTALNLIGHLCTRTQPVRTLVAVGGAA